MADFKTHISTSTMLGIGYGVGAFVIWDVPAQHCIIAAGLCSVAGMLPDLDSETGVPVREMLCFISVLVPMLMLRRFEAMGLDAEQMVFVSALLYAGIRFGVGAIFKKYTKHRGMWHSIPAAAIAGLATFLVCLSPDMGIRLFKSWAVVMGFLSHLILDEIYSVDLYGKKIRIKKSFGTAMKFFSKSPWANFTTYAKLAILIVIAMSDEMVMSYFDVQPLDLKATGGAAIEWVGELLPRDEQNADALLR